MTEVAHTTVSIGKKKRDHLRLPQPYFVVVDDWLDKLGEKSYLLWFKLLAKVDRTDDRKEVVKYTQVKLAKSLGMSKATLLKQLKSLYEYGFIDYIEYHFNNGNVGENIIVYESPQNDEENLMKPLVKLREWENRTNEKYDFTRKGGRPKKGEGEVRHPEEPKPEKVETVELASDIDPTILSEYQHFKESMGSNNADLQVVNNWINRNHSVLPISHICYVFKQLATYPEPVKKTSIFIQKALENAPSTHQPVTYKRPEEKPVERYIPAVPFYNWLED